VNGIASILSLIQAPAQQGGGAKESGAGDAFEALLAAGGMISRPLQSAADIFGLPAQAPAVPAETAGMIGPDADASQADAAPDTDSDPVLAALLAALTPPPVVKPQTLVVEADDTDTPVAAQDEGDADAAPEQLLLAAVVSAGTNAQGNSELQPAGNLQTAQQAPQQAVPLAAPGGAAGEDAPDAAAAPEAKAASAAAKGETDTVLSRLPAAAADTAQSQPQPQTRSDAGAVVIRVQAAAEGGNTGASTGGDSGLGSGQSNNGFVAPQIHPAALGTPHGAEPASFHTQLAAYARGAMPAHPAAEMVKFSLAQAAATGESRITLQLQPAELGRVDIRLDFGSDGRVHAHVVADRPETLGLLRADARGLEQALQNAGLDADQSSLSFDLRGQQHSFDETGRDGNAPGGFASGEEEDTDTALVLAVPPPGLSADGRLDIRV
jgi:flagellar hook-length control protein FliK